MEEDPLARRIQGLVSYFLAQKWVFGADAPFGNSAGKRQKARRSFSRGI
jgi:hypothetical protein